MKKANNTENKQNKQSNKNCGGSCKSTKNCK